MGTPKKVSSATNTGVMNLKSGTHVLWVITKNNSKKKSKFLGHGHRPHPF